METTSNKFCIPFTRILLGKPDFVIETEQGRYQLSTDISEHYIMMNLTEKVKKNGKIIVQINETKEGLKLLPIALLHDPETTWITVTPDENTDVPIPENTDYLRPLLTSEGKEYADGFIDSSRTFLSYKQLMKYEANLHHSLGYYAKEFYSHYYRDYPEGPYDVRLHYYMIKSIRKHKHYSDDFANYWVNIKTFYHGWTDPFPGYLYIKTFGKPDSWSSYAKMRLMVENECREGIPLALKVLKNKTINQAIQYYAIVLAGLDESNDESILPFTESNKRALLRVWYNRGAAEFYATVLENAKNIEKGSADDILDDPPKIYTGEYDKYDDYVISHRGYISFYNFTQEQIQEVGEIYLRIAHKLSKPLSEEQRLRLGNAFRSFLIALISNTTQATTDLLEKIYTHYNTLLYGTTAQDSTLTYIDTYLAQYLYDYVEVNNLKEEFWNKLSAYSQIYDRVYSNQRFFLVIYAKVGYNFLNPQEFYNIFWKIIDDDYVDVEAIWQGVTGGYYLPTDAKPLDHRWKHMFEDFDYYAWSEDAWQIYQLIKHRIEPHPKGWTIENWYEEQENEEYDEEDYDEDEEYNEDWEDDIDVYDEYAYVEEDYDEEQEETEEIIEDEYHKKTKVKTIAVDAKIFKEAEKYYEKIYNWKEAKFRKEEFRILEKLYWRIRDESCNTFPNETDKVVIDMEEKEIIAINTLLKTLLEKIDNAPKEKIQPDDESRYTPYYKLIRSYVVALSLNEKPAAKEFIDYIYENYNEILYARELDNYNKEQQKYWLNFLINYTENKGLLKDFWKKVDNYFIERDKKGYWNYAQFYIALTGKLAIRMLSSEEFYNKFYKRVESNFMVLKTLFEGILSDNYMKENNIEIDARWQQTFNRWVDDWEFDIALTIFEQIIDHFPSSVPRESDKFFTRYPQ